MSKEEFLKIQTCVLKVNIHCDGCKDKVKKILHKIEGVYTTKIDAEQGKVTVSGNVDAATVINKLIKNGKHAELWGAPKPKNNNNQNQLNNQLKNLPIGNGKGGGNNKGQGQKGGGGLGGGNNQAKGGQNQQLQKMKRAPEDLKMLPKCNNVKSVKFKMPEDEDMSDDDDDYDDDDDSDDDDELDDDLDDTKMKKMMGSGHGGQQIMVPKIVMPNMMMKPGGNNGGNGKKGGGSGGNVPVLMNQDGGGNGGKKGGGNQNQGGGKGGKNNGGGQNNGQNKNGNHGKGGGSGSGAGNGGKTVNGMNDGHHSVPNMMAMKTNPGLSHKGNMPPMGHNIAAVQGLPASAMSAGADAGGGPGNPYYPQQLAAMMMNQQRAQGNEGFQPMMYARPPPAVNYMPPYPPYPYPYPYPYPPLPGERADQYAMFSDENISSCNVM